jgi:RNA polymerase sigma-70 factor, ECF subfamily
MQADIEINLSLADPSVGGSSIEESYLRHRAALARYVLARTRNPELAADVVQEAFLRLAEETAVGRQPDVPLAWLRRVALNLVISGARRSAIADRWEPRPRPTAETATSPERIAIDGERRAIISTAVSGLEPIERTAVLLAAQGFRCREIADRIGRTEGATRTLLCRARARLRAQIQEAV